MTARRLLAALAVVTCSLAATFDAAPAAAGGSGIIDVGGGHTKPGYTKPGTITGEHECTGPDQRGRNVETGVVNFEWRFPGCYGFNDWTYEIKECLMRYEVWRFYGTATDPARAWSVSSVRWEDPCANRGADGDVNVSARLYYPQSADAPHGQVQPIFQRLVRDNVLGQSVAGADNCPATGTVAAARYSVGGDGYDGRAACNPTSVRPWKWSTESCKSLQPEAARSVNAALQSTDKLVKTAAQQAVWNQYTGALARGKDYAETWSGVPASSSPQQASDITRVVDTACASPMSFMAVAEPRYEGEPEPPAPPATLLGVCVAAVSRPARMFNIDGTATSPTRPGFYNQEIYGDEYGNRYSKRLEPTEMLTPERTDPRVLGPLVEDRSYSAAYRKVIHDEVYSRPDSLRPGGNFWPSPFKSVYDWVDSGKMSKKDSADSAEKYSRCFTQEIAPLLPQGSPVSPPCEQVDLTTCPHTRVEEPGPEGMLHIELATPKVMRVGGTLRPSRITVRSAVLYCGNDPCSGDLAPRLTATTLDLAFTSSSGSYRECATLTARGCQYYIEKAGSGTDRSLDVYLFSPTNNGERLQVGLQDTSYTYQRATKVRTCYLTSRNVKKCADSVEYHDVDSTSYTLIAKPDTFTVVGSTTR